MAQGLSRRHAEGRALRPGKPEFSREHFRLPRVPWLLLLLAFVLWPATASADLGTAFMWYRIYLLWFGTAAIGVGEGLLIGLVFRVRIMVAVWLMLLANYVSMVAGVMLSGPLCTLVYGTFMKAPPLYDLPRLHWILVSMSFVATLVVEWPFCLLAVWRKAGRWWKSLAADGLAQTASYAVLVLAYVHISQVGLYRDVNVDRAFVSSVSSRAFVYFVSADDKRVSRIHLNGTGREDVAEVKPPVATVNLFPRLAEDGEHVDLWWSPGDHNLWDKEEVVVQAVGALPNPHSFWFDEDPDHNELDAIDWGMDGAKGSWGPVLDLRSTEDREWKLGVGRWGDRLVLAENSRTGESLRLSLETPYLECFAGHATVLPGDLVVFCLVSYSLSDLFSSPAALPDQILLLDLRARKLGFVAYGRSPVVVFPDEGAPTQSSVRHGEGAVPSVGGLRGAAVSSDALR